MLSLDMFVVTQNITSHGARLFSIHKNDGRRA